MSVQYEQDVNTLYQRHAATIQRFIYRRVFNLEDANELTHDVFRAARTTLQAGRQVDIAWLIATAKNLIQDLHPVSGRPFQLAEHLKSSILSDGRASSGGMCSEVGEVLDKLRERDREVLMLAYWDGLHGEDLGRVLGCTAASATSRLTKARQAFAQIAPAHLVQPFPGSESTHGTKEV